MHHQPVDVGNRPLSPWLTFCATAEAIHWFSDTPAPEKVQFDRFCQDSKAGRTQSIRIVTNRNSPVFDASISSAFLRPCSFNAAIRSMTSLGVATDS